MANGKTYYSGARTPEEVAQAERAWAEYEERPETTARKEKLKQDMTDMAAPSKPGRAAKPAKKAPGYEEIGAMLGTPPPPSATTERKMPNRESTSLIERTAMAQAQAADMYNAKAGINSNYTGQVLALVEHTRANREAELMQRAAEKARAFGACQDWQRTEMLGTIGQLARMAAGEREGADAERARTLAAAMEEKRMDYQSTEAEKGRGFQAEEAERGG